MSGQRIFILRSRIEQLMKTLFTLFLLSAISLGSFAQGKIPKTPYDYYVTKQGDTVYGSVFWGLKNDGFKPLNGQRMKLKPDSVASYAFYLANNNRGPNDPFYFARTFINVENKFYEIEYTGDGPVRVLFRDASDITGLKNVMPSGMGMAAEDEVYYFERNGVLTKFYASKFYAAAQKYFADCPSVVEFLDHVPNERKPEKTHKAGMHDLKLIMSKYTACVKH